MSKILKIALKWTYNWSVNQVKNFYFFLQDRFIWGVNYQSFQIFMNEIISVFKKCAFNYFFVNLSFLLFNLFNINTLI